MPRPRKIPLSDKLVLIAYAVLIVKVLRFDPLKELVKGGMFR